ncbi:MAG: hypothetical protein ACKO0U_05915 [Gammaproteobacteria bacterium]
MSTATQRTQLRKSLLQLSSLLLLALLSMALLAQFAVWSLQRAHVEGDRETARLMAALDASRLAQVQFKRQVQEWKNILLRGADPLQRSRYYDQFSGAEVQVSRALDEVTRQLDALGIHAHDATLGEVRNRHRVMGEEYRAALTAVSGGRWAPFVADRAVRGLDRPLDALIDRLALQIVEEARGRSVRLDQSMRERYELLRYGLWIAIACALLAVSALLLKSLRDLGKNS